MNIQIFNLIESNKIQKLDKNLSIPSVLHYQSHHNTKNLNNIISNFTCNKKDYCIDKNLYTCLLNNIKPNKEENKSYTKQMTKRKNKKHKSTRKTSKKLVETK
tara:strand:- start:6147 stop:6455 length:309 start_codon:yes stop_codon:yes gene_type:complete